MRIFALLFGLVLNAFGNSLTIISACGSGIWTASAVNMNEIFGIEVGTIIFILGVINAITNQLLIWRIDILRFIEEIIFISCFSYFINIFTSIFRSWGWADFSIWVRVPMTLIGVICFCTAISLYQRANIFMHPNDDTTNILRFKFLKGSAIKSQLLDMTPPIIIIILCGIKLGHIDSVGIGTIFSIAFNGVLIQTADKWILPKLKHNKNINQEIMESKK
ncbi:hypothetical protein MOO46_04240 [Apilactobacillus apisilvae]|uniref:Sugar specific permease n=1 Tax=Apilactobacillus apisilvae TaxID=2923364 RepID=A0ABY4PF80_9LACO|nr:hypothetical protein [Apilactobacillus apisilvae]UQS84469.1 hypothetical protein MOO46_04240 [Apilactobacillus apisilvae]